MFESRYVSRNTRMCALAMGQLALIIVGVIFAIASMWILYLGKYSGQEGFVELIVVEFCLFVSLWMSKRGCLGLLAVRRRWLLKSYYKEYTRRPAKFKGKSPSRNIEEVSIVCELAS